MITYVTGDLFDSDADAIAHGVNTYGFMNGGIAAQFKERFPLMYEEYGTRCQDEWFTGGDMMPYHLAGVDRWVYNLATQIPPGRNAKLTYTAASMHRMFEHAYENFVQSIAMPKIGCGIGGLEWPVVENIIDDLTTAYECEIDIEVWSL